MPVVSGLVELLPIYARKFLVEVLEFGDEERLVEELANSRITRDKFLDDLKWLNGICNDGPMKTFCHQRLTFLQTQFSQHMLLNDHLENTEHCSVPHRDFSNVRKVDTLYMPPER